MTDRPAHSTSIGSWTNNRIEPVFSRMAQPLLEQLVGVVITLVLIAENVVVAMRHLREHVPRGEALCIGEVVRRVERPDAVGSDLHLRTEERLFQH